MSTATVQPDELEAHLEAVDQRHRELAEGGDAAILARLEAAVTRRSNQERARLMERAYTAPSAAARVHWLRAEVEVVTKAVAPLAACRAGCSHCCHTGVSVPQVEAEVIAKAIGRKLARPPIERMIAAEDMPPEGKTWDDEPTSTRLRFAAKKYFLQHGHMGEPCTFLRGDRCSIYEHRPLACRMHLSLDRDALLCRLVPGMSVAVPYFNFAEDRQHHVQVLGERGLLADIRDWFPKQKGQA